MERERWIIKPRSNARRMVWRESNTWRRISKRIIRKNSSSPGLGFARFLFIVVLTVLLFVLVNSMVRHHFFSGGQMNQHEVTGP